MTNKNKLLTALILSSSAVAATAVINKCIKVSAVSQHLLEEPQSRCFHWRLGNIHYTKSGTGRPLLLIHDVNFASSGFQWKAVAASLASHYTVYTIDLLGCGRSEKPYMTYTNYLYVQLISDFIRSEIGHRTDVIAAGNACNFTIMACSNFPELFDHLILVNPESILSCSQMPGKYAKLYKGFLDTPVIGTLLYNMASSKQALRDQFSKYYFYNPYSVKESCINAYHEAAHLGYSPRSVYACVHCNYINCNITNALKKIDNSICLIGGENIEHEKEILEEYTVYNSAIEYTMIPESKYLPHMEKPAEFLAAVQPFLS